MAADNLAFPWARSYDADQLAAFIEDLWGAASGDDDLKTLDAIEAAVAKHRPLRECPITKREAEFLTYMAEGLTYEQVTIVVGRSRDSVRTTYSTAFSKLGARCGAQAVAIALHNGWLPTLRLPDPPKPLAMHGPRNWRALHAEAAAQMRAHPLSFVDVGPYASRNSASQAARRVNLGLIPEFNPAGAFEARPHRIERTRWGLRMRYLGEPAAPTTPTPERTAP
ncbi:LuxR C-terminal-related transcriptional regulator [Streptomyces sp. 3214.6]|uniref:LuxR C-terminal-related transcriptional regulator n=1 Tax=Streptomyces sp. 3214.6 TaxID=1882757 RepID=UPI00090C87CE|nr:LuxR C-terminal-related transcriptional regulator [Streptomyces sp. 3214.6]SHI65290.1 regulatory protein, luxR family [Streptomyces sp. 3214.6]